MVDRDIENVRPLTLSFSESKDSKVGNLSTVSSQNSKLLNDKKDHINDANIIELNRDILQYPFDKELFLLYLNGKKVFNDSIQNFSANKIRLLNESIDQNNRIVKITICRYIQYIRV